MTSASELFYTRRSGVRSHRTSFSSHQLSFFHSHSHSHSPSPQHRRRRRLFHVRIPAEQGSMLFDTEIRSTNSSPHTDRLPGNVLLARERLLERLRGVSISQDGQTNRAFSGNSLGDDVSTRNDHRLIDVGNLGPENSVISPAADYHSLDMTLHTYRPGLPRKTKKPPGLTQEDIDSLHVKVFSTKEDVRGDAWEALGDCSICLESFSVGDELICLPCRHEFHSACLNPWIRTCGDCPYCRRDINIACQRDSPNT